MMKRITKRYLFAVGLILVIVGILTMIRSYTVVNIRQSGQRLVYEFQVDADRTFSIRYIHSIHRTPVTEHYKVDENLNLVLESVMFDSYGVGIPSELEPGETFSEQDGKFVLGNINRQLPYFDQRIGQVIANHTLLVHGTEIPLSEWSPPGTWVRFQAERVNGFQLCERRITRWINSINFSR